MHTPHCCTSAGPFAIGYTLCFTLMGALVVQAYVYFTRFADDRRIIKALVIVTLLLEVLISAGVIVALGGLFVESAAITPYALLVLSPMAGLGFPVIVIGFANDVPSMSYKLSPWLVTWLGSSLVCDLAITICMILSLRPSNSHFSSSKSTLVKLTRLTIETGLVTSVAALLELILGVVYEGYFYHLVVFFAISKLWVIATGTFDHSSQC
ncbi:hypothetical protein JVT61DRAFT_4725 [Boletus reticuloceps]|uniref:DUF6534 domain-containing protein n=1 Tax=Boletus reticuloceps TaxID=495285 RepID=A0A8I2YMX2_9AGAM|nr:hypothetical protein JVT61DRAFT_4725 [Boletus reticuloceps]